MLLAVCWVGQEVKKVLMKVLNTPIWLTQHGGCVLPAPDPPLRQIPQAVGSDVHPRQLLVASQAKWFLFFLELV